MIKNLFLIIIIAIVTTATTGTNAQSNGTGTNTNCSQYSYNDCLDRTLLCFWNSTETTCTARPLCSNWTTRYLCGWNNCIWHFDSSKCLEFDISCAYVNSSCPCSSFPVWYCKARPETCDWSCAEPDEDGRAGPVPCKCQKKLIQIAIVLGSLLVIGVLGYVVYANCCRSKPVKNQTVGANDHVQSFGFGVTQPNYAPSPPSYQPTPVPSPEYEVGLTQIGAGQFQQQQQQQYGFAPAPANAAYPQ
jgi:hypothetical protein